MEAHSILDLAGRIDENFSRAVELLYHCKGRVVLMGMGKSGLVGRKIASTFASTGTPAFFLHPAEGLNGDFGMLAKEDVVIAISNSGETRELLEVLPLIKRYGNRLITLTGNMNIDSGEGRRCLPRYPCEGRGLSIGFGSDGQHDSDPCLGRCLGGRSDGEERISRKRILPFSTPVGHWGRGFSSRWKT